MLTQLLGKTCGLKHKRTLAVFIVFFFLFENRILMFKPKRKTIAVLKMTSNIFKYQRRELFEPLTVYLNLKPWFLLRQS